MSELRRWTVRVYVGEDGGRTYAEAALEDHAGVYVLGTGRATVNPADHDVPEIGDEIAVGRALIDIGHQLLNTASKDIEWMTHEPVRLSR